jgi:hypothetical protein
VLFIDADSRAIDNRLIAKKTIAANESYKQDHKRVLTAVHFRQNGHPQV